MEISKQAHKVAVRVMQEMFQVKPGEVVAITADSGSDPALTQAFFKAAEGAGAKPLVLQFSQASNNGQAGMADWPAETLIAALKTVDVWLETNVVFTLYSDIWEDVMRDNKTLRYNTIPGSTVESLDRVFCHYDIKQMGKVLAKMADMAAQAKTISVKTAKGTAVCFETDPNNLIDYDDGDFSRPKFCTAPGYLNLVPKSGTLCGRIVFDMIMHVDLSIGGRVELLLEEGKIVEFIGDKAPLLEQYIASFNEENMSKISHMMIGVCPGVQKLSWEIVEDERVWGGVSFGFGHTSARDMPPVGQPASSHFDGVATKASVWFDDQQILNNGEFIHPDIRKEAERLLDGRFA